MKKESHNNSHGFDGHYLSGSSNKHNRKIADGNEGKNKRLVAPSNNNIHKETIVFNQRQQLMI
jgi:hypothetical protein